MSATVTTVTTSRPPPTPPPAGQITRQVARAPVSAVTCGLALALPGRTYKPPPAPQTSSLLQPTPQTASRLPTSFSSWLLHHHMSHDILAPHPAHSASLTSCLSWLTSPGPPSNFAMTPRLRQAIDSVQLARCVSSLGWLSLTVFPSPSHIITITDPYPDLTSPHLQNAGVGCFNLSTHPHRESPL